MSEVAVRPYRQVARAAATADTRRRIVAAFADALLGRWMEEITLDEVARAAGTTRQTVIRLFGGKEDLLRAVAEQMKDEIRLRRSLPPNPTPRDAARAVVQDYEVVGDVIIRLLAQEERHPDLGSLLTVGRRSHRAWVEGVFAASLRDLPRARREHRVHQLVTLTDVYVWKLLRRDMHQSVPSATAMIVEMLEKLLGEHPLS